MPVDRLLVNQFAVNLGEPIEPETDVIIEDKGSGVYSLKITMKFSCKKEYVQGGDNMLDPRMGSLAVLKTGTFPAIQVVTPEVNIRADKNDATFMSLSLKIPDGVKGNHD